MKLTPTPCLAALFLIVGCGAHGKPDKPDKIADLPAAAPARGHTAAPVSTDEPRDDMKVEGTLGRIDENDIDGAFRTHLPEINRCYQDVSSRLWYLGGKLELKLRVGEGGQVRSAAVTHSSVGNYDVERCVVQVAQRLSLPAPEGGEAEFTFPVDFPVRAAVQDWPADRVAPQMARHKGELSFCQARRKPGQPGLRVQQTGQVIWGAALRMTLYIGPGGKVTSAGLSADGPIDERVAACLVARVQSFRFEDPLGQLVKASYAFD